MWLTAAMSLSLLGNHAAAVEPVRLFDGTSLVGWTRLDGKPIDDAWEIVDGMLHLKEGRARGANLVTQQEFANFDLQFEWRISPGGNNGLKYRVRRYGNQTLGCEYQILDDAAYTQQLTPRGLTGSLYELYEPNAAKTLQPVGQFNHSRIVVRGDQIEHWLNGHRIVSAEAGSADWFARVAESKFKDYEGFGLNRSGKIMLTDHGSEVWYRNIVLTPLPPPARVAAVARGDSASCHRPACRIFAPRRARLPVWWRGRHTRS
jgi:hypothetical protein